MLTMLVCLVAAGILAGCGGGGGSETVQSNPSAGAGTPPPPPPPPPPAGGGGTGAATLSWQPPTTYSDGSPLTIRGYRFYAGPAQNNLSLVEDLQQPGLSTYMVSGLSAGTWYFAVTAYDAQGIESTFSNIASKAL